jgi:hypothetical protein
MTDTMDGETPGGIAGGAVGAVGTYEADGAVVFYDTENPLAWVQSGVTVALDEAV